MRNSRFINLYVFFTSFVWFYTFGYSVLPTHFLTQGISLQQMVVGQWLRFAAQLIIVPLLIYLSAKRSWIIAILCSLLYILLSIKIFSVDQFYIASILNGFNVTLFYIFYNIAHFKNTPKENRGISSFLMFGVPVIISVITPILAGYLKTTHEVTVWFFTIIFFFITIFLVKFQQDFYIHINIKQALSEIKITRFYILMEGVWESLVFAFIPIYTLFYIKTPLGYGAFLSYIAIVSAIASLFIGHYTDKKKKRAIFIYPITISLAGITLLFITATNNLIMWLIVTGAIKFLLQLFWNVLTSFVVDAHQNIEQTMVGREICLAVGKFIGVTIVYLSFVFEPKPFFLFFILAGAALSIAIKLFLDKNIKQKTSKKINA